jgi:hypothetical protein
VIPHRAMWRGFELFGSGDIEVDESLDLSGASLLEDNPLLERSRLASREFVHCRIVTWHATDEQRSINLTATEFRTPQQAEFSLLDLHDRLLAASGTIRDTVGQLAVTFPATDDEQNMTVLSRTANATQVVVVATGWIELHQLEAVLDAQTELLRRVAPEVS